MPISESHCALQTLKKWLTRGVSRSAYLCRNIPSLATCNLFAKQLLIQGVDPDAVFAGYARTDAGVGVDSSCQIPSVHADGSVGNVRTPLAPCCTRSVPKLNNKQVANIVLCGLSFFVGLGLAGLAMRRVAAVAKGEIAAFFGMYALTCLFQLLDTGAFINQGSAALVWLTAIHIGLIVAMCVYKQTTTDKSDSDACICLGSGCSSGFPFCPFKRWKTAHFQAMSFTRSQLSSCSLGPPTSPLMLDSASQDFSTRTSTRAFHICLLLKPSNADVPRTSAYNLLGSSR